MKKLLLILLLLPMIGFGQKKYKYKNIRFESEGSCRDICCVIHNHDKLLVLKSTEDRISGVVEWGNSIWQRLFSTWNDPLSKHEKYVENGIIISCIGYYKNGKVSHQKEYSDKLSNAIYYYRNGKISMKGSRKGLIMIEESYNKKGVLISVYSWKNSKKDGMWKRDGIWKYYNRKGVLKREYGWKNGKKDGLWKRYNRKGVLRYEKKYKDGKRITIE